MNNPGSKRELRSEIERLEVEVNHQTSMRDMYHTAYEKASERIKTLRQDHEEELGLLQDRYAELLDGLVFLLEETGVAENYRTTGIDFFINGTYEPEKRTGVGKFLKDVKTVKEAHSANEARKRLGIKKGSDNGN